MKTVGLTGGIATGKSTVAAILSKEYDIPIIDADQIARDVVVPGTEGLVAIVEMFTATVLNAEGELDRKKMRSLISQDPTAKNQLEQILHPLIRSKIGEEIQRLSTEGASLIFVEAALIVETGSYKNYDCLWVVSCSQELQIKRLMSRDNCTQAQAMSLIATQAPEAEKRSVADLVLLNNGDTESLRDQVSMGLKTDASNVPEI